MGNLTRISGSFVIPKSFHGNDQNITGSTEFSASNFTITASEGVHITGSMNVSGGVLTVENLHLSGGSITPATSSELYVKYAQTGSFASGSDIQIIKAESASYVMSTSTSSLASASVLYVKQADTGSFASGSDIQIIRAESASYVVSTNTGSFASGSDFQASTTLGNGIANIHRRTGSLELSSSHFRVTASEGIHITGSVNMSASSGIHQILGSSYLFSASGSFSGSFTGSVTDPSLVTSDDATALAIALG